MKLPLYQGMASELLKNSMKLRLYQGMASSHAANATKYALGFSH